jgi:hypothetical protein
MSNFDKGFRSFGCLFIKIAQIYTTKFAVNKQDTVRAAKISRA